MKKLPSENQLKAELRELTDRVRRLNHELRAMTAHGRHVVGKPAPDHQLRERIRDETGEKRATVKPVRRAKRR